MGKVKGRSKRVDVTKHFLRAPHVAEQITVYISGSQSVQATEEDFSQTLGSESAFALRKDGKLDVSMRLCSNWRQGACHSHAACTFAHLKAYLNCPAGVINPVPVANSSSGGSLSYSAVAAIGGAPQSSGGGGGDGASLTSLNGAGAGERSLSSPHRAGAANCIAGHGAALNQPLNDSLTRSFEGESARVVSENDTTSFLSSQHAYSIPPRLQSPRGTQHQVAPGRNGTGSFAEQQQTSRGHSVTAIPSSGASSHERNSIPIPRSQQHNHTDSVNSSGSTPTLTSTPAPSTVTPLPSGANAWAQKKTVSNTPAPSTSNLPTLPTTAATAGVPSTKVVSREPSASVLPSTASWGQRVVQRPINFSSLPTLPSANDGSPPKTSERAQRNGNQSRVPTTADQEERLAKHDSDPQGGQVEQQHEHPRASSDAVCGGDDEVNRHENEHEIEYQNATHIPVDDPIGLTASGNPVGCVGWGSCEASADGIAGGSSQLWSEAYSPWGTSGVASPADPFSPMLDSGARNQNHVHTTPEFGSGSFGGNDVLRGAASIPKATSPNDAWNSAVRALSPDCEPLALPDSGMEDEHFSSVINGVTGFSLPPHASADNTARVTPNYHADPPAPSTALWLTLMRDLVDADETGGPSDNLQLGAASGEEHASNVHWDGAQDVGPRYTAPIPSNHHDHYTQFSTAYHAGVGPSEGSNYSGNAGNGPSADCIDIGVTFSTHPFTTSSLSKPNSGSTSGAKSSNVSLPWDSNGNRNRDEGGAYSNTTPHKNNIQHLLALLTTEE